MPADHTGQYLTDEPTLRMSEVVGQRGFPPDLSIAVGSKAERAHLVLRHQLSVRGSQHLSS
eukprot:3980671-Amphidinium_carterae.1